MKRIGSAATILEQNRRRDTLDAAGRSCDIEGLPAPSNAAVDLYERWIRGELSSGDVCRLLVQYHASGK